MTSYGRQELGEPYRRISVEMALEMQNGGALVIDVRNQDEWDGGHVKGALHVPVDDILGEAEAKIPRKNDLLLICEAGVRSGLACEMLSALGYDQERLYNIEEGTPVWKERNLPVE